MELNTRLTSFVFTVNNPDEHYVEGRREAGERFAEVIPAYAAAGDKEERCKAAAEAMRARWENISDIKAAQWSLERGKEGTYHFQGACILNKPKSLRQVIKLFTDVPVNTPHVDKIRTTKEAAFNYTEKEDTHVAGPWRVGDVEAAIKDGRASEGPQKRAAKRTLLDIQEEACDEIIKDGKDFNDLPLFKRVCLGRWGAQCARDERLQSETTRIRKVKTVCIVGGAGWGKTTTITKLLGWLRKTVQRTQIGADGGKLWFTSVGHRYDVLLLDEFGRKKVSPLEFNMMLDGTPLELGSKGETGFASYDTVIILSNFKPESWFEQQFTKKEYDDNGRLIVVLDEQKKKDYDEAKKACLRRVGRHDTGTTDKKRCKYIELAPIEKLKKDAGCADGDRYDMTPHRNWLARKVCKFLWPSALPFVMKKIELGGMEEEESEEEYNSMEDEEEKVDKMPDWMKEELEEMNRQAEQRLGIDLGRFVVNRPEDAAEEDPIEDLWGDDVFDAETEIDE